MGIKFTLSRKRISEQAIQNLHRFDILLSSVTNRMRFGITDEEKMLENVLFNNIEHISSFQPRYPLAPIDSFWNMQDVVDSSYEFYSFLRPTSTISQDELADILRKSPLFENVEVSGGRLD